MIQCKLYSQKLVFNGKDTLIGYTLKQNDFLIKSLKQLKYYRISDSICDLQQTNNSLIINNLKTIIHEDSININSYKSIIKNDSISNVIEKQQLNNKISLTSKELIREKRLNKIILFGNLAIDAFLIYVYIKK